MDDFWETGESTHTGPVITPEAVMNAESSLGFKLPESYLRLLRIKNGGTPKRCCFPTMVRTSWAEDHIQICTLFGIGFDKGIDGEYESKYMIAAWGYPDFGIVVSDTPSAGHDTVMLDYSECGPEGDPRVIHVAIGLDEPVVTLLAEDFESFARGLADCSQYR